MLPVKIAGLGWYLPEQCITNNHLEKRYGIPAQWIEHSTGVQERRYATTETTISMAAAAARMALDDAALDVSSIDVIICASSVPQQAIPCTAALLQRELHAPEGASACFDINATCLGFLFSLHTVAYLIAAGVYRTVLICNSELPSFGLNPAERESVALFGDAATAAVVTRSQEYEESTIWHALFETHSSGADSTQIRGGGTLHHPNNPTTTPEMNLFHMQGPAVFKQALQVLGPFLDRFFCQIGWERTQLDAVVPHQASRHGIDLLTRKLGFRSEQIVNNLALRGNCVSASIPLALAEAVASGRIQRGNRIMLIGTGAGLTLGTLVLTF